MLLCQCCNRCTFCYFNIDSDVALSNKQMFYSLFVLQFEGILNKMVDMGNSTALLFPNIFYLLQFRLQLFFICLFLHVAKEQYFIPGRWWSEEWSFLPPPPWLVTYQEVLHVQLAYLTASIWYYVLKNISQTCSSNSTAFPSNVLWNMI